MARPDPLAAHCVELLAPLGAVQARRMFGGHGLYLDGLFIAIVAFGRLYLKTDETTAAHFDAAGCPAFEYVARGQTRTSRHYRAAPAEALDGPQAMLPWGRLALQAALAARA
ncbi:MAG: TfoX/Sxy family protein, partial [Burkholderiales bacterium]|nr:TfoX/Sxy family protein [Burkholderiales bacterium]